MTILVEHSGKHGGPLRAFSAIAALLMLLSQGAVSHAAAEAPHVVPAPALDESPAPTGSEETAVLAGGCFWGVQGVFQHVGGVTNAVSGYAGGERQTAHYEMVSSGTTGHAESVSVTFDPRRISYGRILQIYFSVAHDPTETQRAGPRYRHPISLGDIPGQRRTGHIAKAYIDAVEWGEGFRRGDRHHDRA